MDADAEPGVPDYEISADKPEPIDLSPRADSKTNSPLFRVKSRWSGRGKNHHEFRKVTLNRRRKLTLTRCGTVKSPGRCSQFWNFTYRTQSWDLSPAGTY